jgi:hypothetical protein
MPHLIIIIIHTPALLAMGTVTIFFQRGQPIFKGGVTRKFASKLKV